MASPLMSPRWSFNFDSFFFPCSVFFCLILPSYSLFIIPPLFPLPGALDLYK